MPIAPSKLPPSNSNESKPNTTTSVLRSGLSPRVLGEVLLTGLENENKRLTSENELLSAENARLTQQNRHYASQNSNLLSLVQNLTAENAKLSDTNASIVSLLQLQPSQPNKP